MWQKKYDGILLSKSLKFFMKVHFSFYEKVFFFRCSLSKCVFQTPVSVHNTNENALIQQYGIRVKYLHSAHARAHSHTHTHTHTHTHCWRKCSIYLQSLGKPGNQLRYPSAAQAHFTCTNRIFTWRSNIQTVYSVSMIYGPACRPALH